MTELFRLLELPGESLFDEPDAWESVTELDLRARVLEGMGSRRTQPAGPRLRARLAAERAKRAG